MTAHYEAAHLLLDSGWSSPGYVAVADDGTIVSAGRDRLAAPLQRLEGYVVPGMPNVHSHAHHRGLVGWADELSAGAKETLWSWRARMYAHLSAMSPENLEAYAAQAYLEMLKRGFTSVGEFHYVHRDTTGRPYREPAEMSTRIIAAAQRVGIALTLLPAFYTSAGVGRPAGPDQRRFAMTLDDYLELVAALRSMASAGPGFRVGIAPHSLRAVAPDELRELLETVTALPVHIHASERTEEVDEIRAALGAAPVEWLLANAGVDERWTVVHATHVTAAERAGLAQSGAVTCLCPLTEANLADGRFPLAEYRRDGGRWSIGSDANHLIDLAGELRMLEYGQRLAHRRRDTVLTAGETSVGAVLFGDALAGGTQALSDPGGGVRPGLRADLVELDPRDPALAGQAPATVLDAWIFSSASPAVVRNVMVGGQWLIRDGRHEHEEEILNAFVATMRERHAA